MRFSYIVEQFFSTMNLVFSFIKKETHCTYPPVILMIEPTNFCDLQCPMCMQVEMKRSRGFMSLHLFKQFLTKNNGIKRIVFSGAGEPLLHPDLPEMVSFAAAQGILTELNTNGLRLDTWLGQKVIQSNIDSLVISFEGISKGEYDRRRPSADYCVIEQNLKNFITLRKAWKNKRISLTIDCIDFIYSGRQKAIFKQKMLSLGVDYVNFIPLHGWPTTSTRGRGTQDESAAQRYYSCILPWLMMTVLWDGSVVACCDDFDGVNVIGHIEKEISMMNFWNSQAMKDLRSKLMSKDNIDDLICRYCYRIHKSPWRYPFLNRVCRELKEFIFNGTSHK